MTSLLRPPPKSSPELDANWLRELLVIQKNTNMRHVISLLIENEAGALSRVSGLFSARGYNIESLTVAPTEDTSLSRMTIVTSGSDDVVEQITKQLNKLVEVIKIVELEDTAVRREMILIKLKADPVARSQIIDIVQLFRGKTVDVHNDSMVIEATGSPDKLEALLEMLRPYGVRELVQSGLVALARGSKSLTDRSTRGERLKPSAY